MISLELLDCLVEIDNAIQEGEYVCAESGNILHRPIVSIKYSK